MLLKKYQENQASHCSMFIICLHIKLFPSVVTQAQELLHDQRFVDYNATSPDTNAELDRSSGHEAQVSANNTDVLKSSQVSPSGLLRTLQAKVDNNTLTD